MTARLRCAASWARACLLAGLAFTSAAPTLAQTQAGIQEGSAASVPVSTRRGVMAVGASHNVYAAGQTTRTEAPIEGDFVGVGARVIVDRPVKGDATLAGASVDVRAPVGDDVRASGGDIRVESRIGGEFVAAGANITLAQGAQVDQGGMWIAGTAVIDGKVVGPLKVRAQKIVMNGEVTGDADLAGESIELGATARIGGDLVYATRNLNRADGATVAGTTRQETLPPERHGDGRESRRGDDERSSGISWFAGVLSYLGLLACAAVFLLLFPKFSQQAPEFIGTMPWSSLGIGFGAVLGVPVLAVLLFITLLGIPLGVALMALFPGLLLLGYVVGLLFVVWRLRKALHKPTELAFGSTMALVAITLLIVMLIGSLPFIGGLLHFALVIAGVGACVMEWRRRRHTPSASSGPPASGPIAPGSNPAIA